MLTNRMYFGGSICLIQINDNLVRFGALGGSSLN
jgi:hypothetical protein